MINRVYTMEKANELYYKAIRYSIGDSRVEIERMTPERFLTSERTLFIDMYNLWRELLNKVKGDKVIYHITLKVNGDLGDYLNYIKKLIKQEDAITEKINLEKRVDAIMNSLKLQIDELSKK